MLPFRKKDKKPSETLQTIQQEFNQVMFELGDLNYRKHMIGQELSKINSEINTRQQKADDMGKRALKLRQLAQEEVLSKAKEGEKKEATNVEEAN